MRIALIGQAAFAVKILEQIQQQGDEIVHLFAPPDRDGRADPLTLKARELGLPLSQPKSFRGTAGYEHFKSLHAELAVLAFATIIVPERILYEPRFKSICFHPSLLPRHRGASGINWAIIQGDTQTGVTWFWPDDGIDTGPILIQKAVPIGERDTVGSLYFNTLFPLGIETFAEAVRLIKEGRAPAIKQDEKLGTYEPPCRDEHAAIVFDRPAREVYNLVRGCDPQPGSYAWYAGKRLRLYEPTLEPVNPGASPGTIIAIGPDGMRVALEGHTMTVRRVRLEPGAAKVAPAELEQTGAIAPGMQAGAGPG
jgi:methionyl-tRNA formyltransferase